mmetsp:Transcript_49775/g.160065  ORF Transcript_49775/g.160065 Transcript_49775/m.160065 type:complete len:103 (+) Transcript_49775:168-476(+)
MRVVWFRQVCSNSMAQASSHSNALPAQSLLRIPHQLSEAVHLRFRRCKVSLPKATASLPFLPMPLHMLYFASSCAGKLPDRSVSESSSGKEAQTLDEVFSRA